jgi:hypothetical protein
MSDDVRKRGGTPKLAEQRQPVWITNFGRET